MHEIVISFTSG